MQVQSVPISALIHDPNNSRIHDTKNIKAIMGSLTAFGQQKPIVVNKDNVVIAGNGTLVAAKELGWKNINVVKTDLPKREQKAFALADNKTSELAAWDDIKLEETLHELKMEDFDITSIGFDLDDHDIHGQGLTDDDSVPEVPQNIHGVERGQIWQLGNHRLMCGDSTSKEDVDRLMDGEKADMVFTDPPYGIEIVGGGKAFGKVGGGKAFGKVGGGNIIPSNTYKVIEGDTSTEVAIAAFNITSEIKNRIFWGGNYYAHALPETSGWLVWNKEMTGNFGDGELAWTSSEKPLKIFKHTWNGLIKESEKREKRCHPTQKPIALAEWCFENYGNPKSILDLFLGSGSTLIACEKTNRKCYGMEIDPHYCSVIIERWQQYTGQVASLLTENLQNAN